jgi:ubiquinone/menaquinone biosynthesis C-methylase UbiE
MIGCDLSFSALMKLDQVYEARLQADASKCLPLPDNSVDAVVSSFFWEHIQQEVKPLILSEINRILRPGGKLIFLYDVETENPLIKHYKMINPGLYNKQFIEGDGHFGYQTPAENLFILASSGFRILEHQGMEKTWLQSPSSYAKLAQFTSSGKWLLVQASRLGQQPSLYLYTALLRLMDTLICKFLPESWARIDLVVCEIISPE